MDASTSVGQVSRWRLYKTVLARWVPDMGEEEAKQLVRDAIRYTTV